MCTCVPRVWQLKWFREIKDGFNVDHIREGIESACVCVCVCVAIEVNDNILYSLVFEWHINLHINS